MNYFTEKFFYFKNRWNFSFIYCFLIISRFINKFSTIKYIVIFWCIKKFIFTIIIFFFGLVLKWKFWYYRNIFVSAYLCYGNWYYIIWRFPNIFISFGILFLLMIIKKKKYCFIFIINKIISIFSLNRNYYFEDNK